MSETGCTGVVTLTWHNPNPLLHKRNYIKNTPDVNMCLKTKNGRFNIKKCWGCCISVDQIGWNVKEVNNQIVPLDLLDVPENKVNIHRCIICQ